MSDLPGNEIKRMSAYAVLAYIFKCNITVEKMYRVPTPTRPDLRDKDYRGNPLIPEQAQDALSQTISSLMASRVGVDLIVAGEAVSVGPGYVRGLHFTWEEVLELYGKPESAINLVLQLKRQFDAKIATEKKKEVLSYHERLRVVKPIMTFGGWDGSL